MAGAAGAGLAGEGAKRSTATARAARKRVTAHSIGDYRTDARNWPADRFCRREPSRINPQARLLDLCDLVGT